MNPDLAFNYACWKYVGTGADRRLAEVLASTIYGQEALPDVLDTADGRIWPPHVEEMDDLGPIAPFELEPDDFTVDP